MKSIKMQIVELNNTVIHDKKVEFIKLIKSLKKCQTEIEIKLKMKKKKNRKSNKRLRRKPHQEIDRHGRENLRH